VDRRQATEDTLLRGATLQDLVENTEEFFKLCLENNITLNLKKFRWNKKVVLFEMISANATGVPNRPRPEQGPSGVSSSKKSNRHDRSFCGLANQTCNFSDELLSPFKSLLKKRTKFDKLPEFQMTFEKAYTRLSSTKALAFYDITKPRRLIANRSRLFGLGFFLKQEVEPTVFRQYKPEVNFCHQQRPVTQWLSLNS
jgi:hypothetical protein